MYESRKLVYVKDTETGLPNAFGYDQVTKYIFPNTTVSAFFNHLGSALSRVSSSHIEEMETLLTEGICKEDTRAISPTMVEANKK